jgi:glycosyltransferase involved in cell wall biosynthesis
LPVRICIVYDCLYPYTVGGLERWLRAVAERLAAAGHEVDYVTLRQWPEGEQADVPGVRVIAVGPQMPLYAKGRRRLLPPLRFGAGVLAHLARRGGRYDVVHVAAFPYFSLLGAAAVRPLHRYKLVVDWFEVWARDYWCDYLGRVGGTVGFAVQKLCIRVRQSAFCFSRLHAARLKDEGMRGPLTLLRGLYAGPPPGLVPARTPPTVVFAGRHIPEKRVPALVPAIAAARSEIPELRCEILGDGPERAEVLRRVAALGLEDVVDVPGFVPAERVHAALASALCLVLPSQREGYGLVVVEAAASATPSVVVAGPDNAATELVDSGENGMVARSTDARDLADAIVGVYRAGPQLRTATAEWFVRNEHELALSTSLEAVVAAYARR